MRFCIQFALLAVIMLTIALLPNCAFSAESLVKIGIVLPMSGNLAKVGETHIRGHEFAKDEINSMGGVSSLGGAQIDLIYGDSKGDPIAGIRETHRLASNGVVALMGAYQSSVVYPTAEVAELLHIPYIVTTALSDKITKRDFKYTFRPEATISDFVRDQFAFIKYLRRHEWQIDTVLLLYEDSLFGQFSAILQRDYARKHRLNIVAEIAYPAIADDLSLYVLMLRKYSADVILQTSYLLDSIKIAKLMHKYSIHPKAIIATGAGPKDPEYIRVLGCEANNWFVVNEWNSDMRRPGAKELNRRFRERYGVDMDGISAMSYVSTWVLKDAIERAATLDREGIRLALSATNIQSGPASILPLGYVAFDGSGQNDFVTLITQIGDGKHYTVWPPGLASREPIPMRDDSICEYESAE